ncbi:MAG: 1-acyl-sn-glycerol-3-phosphate acyltransferase [Gammaproteobacteria bacterium]|nr:MAG: 1-acyl-sn-glycerol-3-phosphate acyltransferase [Gammaproteobacteria bacterium]
MNPERIWRLFATGLSFALFGLGGVLLALTWFPLLLLCVRNRRRRSELAQAGMHRMLWLFSHIMQWLGAISFEIDDISTLRNLHGTLVVANHPSLIDVVLIMGHMRHTRAVVKKGVWQNPFMAATARACDFIPNHADPERLIDSCTDALREGSNLCIFPQGSRRPAEDRSSYQRGFAHVALASGADILPLTITVDPPFLRKGEPWYAVPPTRSHWKIRVLDPIKPDAAAIEQGSITARSLTRNVQRIIQTELEGVKQA